MSLSFPDALTSLISFPAIAGAMYGLPILDPLAGVAVSLLIARMGLTLTYESMAHLVDRLTPRDLLLLESLTTVATATLQSTHSPGNVQLIARPLARKLHIQVFLFVPGSCDIDGASILASAIQSDVLKASTRFNVVFETYFEIDL